MPKKSYNAPFWIFLVLAVYVMSSDIWAYIKVENASKYSFQKVYYSYWNFAWPFLLFIDAALYRVMRKKIRPTIQIVWHIITVITGFVIMPIVFELTIEILARTNISALDYAKLKLTLSIARFILFFGLLLIGHAFFITTIVKAFKKKKSNIVDDGQSLNLLDAPPTRPKTPSS